MDFSGISTMKLGLMGRKLVKQHSAVMSSNTNNIINVVFYRFVELPTQIT